MAKKNLYQVVDTQTGDVIASGFSGRENAKPRRNKENEKAKSKVRFIVTRGDENPRGVSDWRISTSSSKRRRKRRKPTVET